MKKFNLVMFGVSAIFAVLLFLINIYFSYAKFGENSRTYRVSANRIEQEIKRYEEQYHKAPDDLETLKRFSGVSEYPAICSLHTIKIQDISEETLRELLEGQSKDYLWVVTKENIYQIAYEAETKVSAKIIEALNFFAVVVFVIIFIFLLYIREKIVRPFQRFSELPLELSKGNLAIPLKAEKSHYFGRFIWGMDLLREHLEENKSKELELQKERKLLLLSLSHDIKTPLSAIKLYAKALSRNLYKNEEKKQEIAVHINEKVTEIEEYISEIVKASNEDFMEFEVNNEEVYIGNVLELIKAYYREKMELNQIDFSVGPYSNCLVLADENRLIEVIQNIVENAIKYGDGKKIWLEIKREPEECQIIVKNTGCTLEEKELPHICDSFFRGSNVGKETGSGLGLYICRKLMHLMEGEIVPQITSDFHQKIMEVTVIVQTVK